MKKKQMGRDGGWFQGVRWSLRWVRTTQAPIEHVVTLREGETSKVVYRGPEYNDAHGEFMAEQGKHYQGKK